jgi:formylglycine-generating enzyme required for sulfatase activity/energy-coupling factor transporter ATP-binding protein EcfA2
VTERPDSNHIQKLLKNFPKEKFVGMSGLALLCGATVFALSGDPNTALLGSVGSNVLAAKLQQHFEKVQDLPTADENERLTQFAQSLAQDIQRSGKLRKEVGDFLQTHRTIEIAAAIVKENPVQGWLLTETYSEVLNNSADLQSILAMLTEMMAQMASWSGNKDNDDKALLPYLKMVARRSERLPLAPLDPGGGERVDISLGDVFVSLKVQESLVYEEIKKAGKNWIGVANAAIAHLHKFDQIILLGDAGSGKSTLLRHLSYCLVNASLKPEQGWLMKLKWQKGYANRSKAENLADFSRKLLSDDDNEERPEPIALHWQAPAYVPVLVELREFARTAFDPHSSHALWHYVEQSLINDDLAETVPALKKKAQCGELIFLFDGVDEVANEKRVDVWQAIAALHSGPYGDNRWIATCRILSFVQKEAPVSVPVQTIQPFDQDQIDQFIQKWTEALKERGELTTDEARTFLKSLREATRTRLAELAPNPMLLTIIVLVQKYHGTLPKERAKLYEACVETMMLRWQQHKEKAEGKEVPSILTQLGISKEDFERLLWELAWRAHSKNPAAKGTADIAEAEILRVARQPKFFNNDLEKIGKFINYTKDRAHLLSFKGGVDEPIYTFPHRTFQEYLAANSLLVNRRLHRMIAELAAVGSPWREVLNLATGILVFNENKREAAIGLVEAVLPEATPTELAGWHQVWLAGEMALEVSRNWLELDEVGQELLPLLRTQLAALLQAGALTPQQRAEAGKALALLGDPREAVHSRVPQMVDVPAGAFLMGSDKQKDKDTRDTETPQHEVILPAYRIGKYLVTNAQFAHFVTADGYDNKNYWTKAGWERKENEGWTEPRYLDDASRNQENQPVVGVSWYEAVAYCNWLKATTGRDFRLPDEAMWEKAARGVDGRIYPWGNKWQPEKLNSSESNINRPSAVGMYPQGKSPFEAYDMCGNVWEWCSTAHGEKYPFQEQSYDQEIEGDAPRRLRGGAFIDDQWLSRAAFRSSGSYPHVRDDDVGFRVAEHLSISDS